MRSLAASRLAFTDPALWRYAFGFPGFLRIESPRISMRKLIGMSERGKGTRNDRAFLLTTLSHRLTLSRCLSNSAAPIRSSDLSQVIWRFLRYS